MQSVCVALSCMYVCMYVCMCVCEKYVYTAELLWLEHLLNHENMFETGAIRAKEWQSLRQIRRHNMDIFSVFFNMKVCYVLSLELPRRDDCNEYTQYTIFNIKRKFH